MNDIIKSAGWFVELTRCKHFDANKRTWFAVNLIVPQASKEDPKAPYWVSDGAKRAECSGASASAQLTDLLYPWRWTAISWKLWGSSDGRTWQEIAVVG